MDADNVISTLQRLFTIFFHNKIQLRALERVVIRHPNKLRTREELGARWFEVFFNFTPVLSL